MYRDRRNLVVFIAAIAATAIVSAAITGFCITQWNRAHPAGISFEKKAVNTNVIGKYIRVRNLLKSSYYKPVDENKMLEGAIAGMADSLGDRYTAYYTADQWKVLEEDIEGSYVGIGVSIKVESDGLVTLDTFFAGSPAKAAGMLSGDKIVKVEGKDVTGMKSDDVIKLIKGKENSKVKITVLRPSSGKNYDFDVTRKKVKVDNISSKVLSGNIGYIRIDKFDAEIASYFEDRLDKLLDKKIRGLIIDLRDDPGGYYDQVVAIADRLLPKGVIVYTEDKNQKREYKYSDSTDLEVPIAVLINGNSASASEILAGAIKDNHKGTLVGTKSYGKGLVQSSLTFADGSGFKFTIQRYFTPSGVCIQGTGIQPDVKVELAEKYANVPVSEVPEAEDVQLQKAIGVVQSEIK